MPSNYTTCTKCRVCESKNLISLFSLGNQFVSDFVDKDEILTGNKVPIDIDLCGDCTLVQTRHTAPSDLMYKQKYWYRSGITQTMRSALEDITTAVEQRVELKEDDVVLDIGANDGTLLNQYALLSKLRRVGCEPANNLAEECQKHCWRFMPTFWSVESWNHYVGSHVKAKVVTAIGMMYDMEDPNQFVADIAEVLAPDGLFVAQLMCLKQTLEKRDVGNFAHEHLEFYSLTSLKILLHKHGLEIDDIEENSVNGGSYRLFIKHIPSLRYTVVTSELHRVQREFAKEEGVVDTLATYISFFQEIDRNRKECAQFVQNAVAAGKKVWVYGASTKGNVIAQFYGLDASMIRGAADRDPNKWGKYMIGSGIPITSEEQFRAANPDFAIILPYAFQAEMLERESEWRSRGGKFIVPLPEFKVI